MNAALLLPSVKEMKPLKPRMWVCCDPVLVTSVALHKWSLTVEFQPAFMESNKPKYRQCLDFINTETFTANQC